ncbi:CusA/CzcA family heavy metal efflux RND transporter [Flavitalea sp. BT771]|uniref:CusA/CzcA family heavy metal efflux RND transporter n=1 Tax=Flavitalea sp. BT771 TaxID=3063329 RepID=UPI0026E18F74|nr:CusA/CzcA family heavy metal efflux RND transporter [Flavitalea sp. BT771]MDO6430235.1 CusA/CzcA family heavy metal efflux RND transporter [Flavitalea sp. BT771]MDV6219625.1 CusA/CzcA family heavy metal efflux RND transporter [Flavitalea sp. BT771]
MLNAIISFSVRNKLIVGIFILILVGWGAYSVTQLPIDAVPDITNNQVLIITTSPSLGAPDVERFITVPVEQATRNVPGIVEQRSFSRFGLSLVTIVFNDATDVYWARQQVGERLAQARQQIPAGMGDPQLGPVTTGLGEIFQYAVRPKPGYESKYDLNALRDIQDWIIRRQLLGTEGVADVSSFGGKVRQYEVTVNPERLKSFQLTIADVYKSIQANNQNAGGAYIEKGPNVLFIRTEGLAGSLDDIGNIVVRQTNTRIPVLVRDVADVRMGSAIRYGAMLFNDAGEVSGAVVMMLKGENSSKVIGNIKRKIKEIEKTLPEGTVIEPFLDRSKMVGNAITTVEHNLLEGALIVIGVLILFLGNVRAGLLVASVIPLSMLFAIIMMNIFGVSGNLMSLGALDFGLLVDGAVIIVEAVIHKLSHGRVLGQATTIDQGQMNEAVEVSAGKMMSSAVFGQVIILIVYLPILSLRGIEGKMFRPMAETVSFAIIGAFLLSLTYVPMVSALFLSKRLNHRKTISDRLIEWLLRIYRPLLKIALRGPRWVITAAVVVFAFSVFLLTRLGGEFIPQLEEGDFAVDTRLLTGSSLTHTIRTTQQSARILLDSFPEVEKVVTKIGSGEIPTDPMPLEAADMMVILKPKAQWKSAASFPELANKMSAALEEVPGIATGFQFPVQMRFNELMTGARQDVVCKIFGDDLDTLSHYEEKLGRIIQTVKGARDLYMETVTGVPQLVIRHNRAAMASYGASISDVNNTIQSAYAGAAAGLVFEGDRRYDLVIRMQENWKRDPANIGNLPVGLSNGDQVPLSTLAMVAIQDGPYQIQREDAHRRISVGFNVRGRDVQSIVQELQEKVSRELHLPAGYYITYGGQYENLQAASRRLSIALPIALLLIFLMLFFAFGRIKYSLLIFSAIPLSAIGGVLALWARGMPFSISAGVGFIALFGVAVLNGIVLISEMNRLKEQGMGDARKIIFYATEVRLRPVLMTAAVASLGFLPMALSDGAGAEVQRPLATVVIGGLVTSTLLTLLVLPTLYLMIEKSGRSKKSRNPGKLSMTALLLLALTAPAILSAQETRKLSLEEALQLAAKQNGTLNISRLQEKYYATLQRSAADIPRTQLSTEWGNINSAAFDNRFTIAQTFSLPSVYSRQRDLFTAEANSAQARTTLQTAEIARLVKLAYLQLQVLREKQLLLEQMDSIYLRFSEMARLRFEKGESNLLEKTTLENQAQQIALQLGQTLADRRDAAIRLGLLLNMEDPLDAADRLALPAASPAPDSGFVGRHPMIGYYHQQEAAAAAMTRVQRSRLLPDISFGYTNQSIAGWQLAKDRSETWYGNANRFSTVQLGVSIPVFNRAQQARIKAAQQQQVIAGAASQLAVKQLQAQLSQTINAYAKYAEAVAYYHTSGLTQSNTLLQTAILSYRNGAIGYVEWGALAGNAIQIRLQYIEAISNLVTQRIELDYLLTY